MLDEPEISPRLALVGARAFRGAMCNEELVTDLLTRLPHDVSLWEIAREVEFIAGVREGVDQLEQGAGVEIDEVEKMIGSWTTK